MLRCLGKRTAYGRLSPLAKGFDDLILERLDEIGQNGAVLRLQEGLDRHAGHELQPLQPRDLGGRDADAAEVVGQARLLVLGDVGRDDLQI